MPQGAEGNSDPGQNGGAAGQPATVPVPGYVKDNLGKEVAEAITQRIEKDPEFAKRIPASLPELWKGWDSSQSELANALRRPAENASKEEWASFYKKLGRPDSPKDYAFDKPDLPKGMEYDQTLVDAVTQAAFEEGVSGKALKAIISAFNQQQVKTFNTVKDSLTKAEEERKAARAKARDASLDAQRKAWGTNFDSNLALVRDLFGDRKRMPESLQKRLMEAGLDNDPEMQSLLLAVARRTSEDRKLGLNGEPGEQGAEPGKLEFPNTRKRFPPKVRK